MTCNLSDPNLIESYQRVLKPSCTIDYLVAGYDGSRDTVKLYCEDDGGFEEMRETVLSMKEVVFIFIRIQHKYALITYISEGVSGVRRARALVHGRQVADLFARSDLQMTVTSEEDLKEEPVLMRLKLTSCPQFVAERRRESLIRNSAGTTMPSAVAVAPKDEHEHKSALLQNDFEYGDVRYDFEYIPPPPKTPLSPEVDEVYSSRKSFIRIEEDTAFDTPENSVLFDSSPSQSHPSFSTSDSHDDGIDMVHDLNMRDLSRLSFQYDHYNVTDAYEDDVTEYEDDDDGFHMSTPIIPPRTKKGSLTSDEGLLSKSAAGDLMEINESVNQGKEFKLRLYRITAAGTLEIFNWGKERPQLVRSFSLADIENIVMYQSESMLMNSLQIVLKHSPWTQMDDYLVYFNSKTDLNRFVDQVRVI